MITLHEALHRLHIFIKCSYVRELFGHYGPDYTTHLINYGQNNPNGRKKIIHITQHHKNYWDVNPMTIDDLHNFCLGFIDHNMIVGFTLGPCV